MSAQDIINKLIDAFNRHDANAFAALHAAKAVAYDPQYTDPLQGKEAIGKDIEDFFVTFPDVQATLTSILANDDTVACEMEMNGTNKGPIVTPTGEIPATDRRMEMRVALFVRFDDQGLITQSRRYFDMAGLMQQLGLP